MYTGGHRGQAVSSSQCEIPEQATIELVLRFKVCACNFYILLLKIPDYCGSFKKDSEKKIQVFDQDVLYQL